MNAKISKNIYFKGDMAIVPVVLAGGFGTRLWPVSTKENPKQFAKLIGEESLFQQTINRILDLSEAAAPLIICNNHHYEIVTEQFKAIGVEQAQIILEPIGRGTAPAIAIAALISLARGYDPLLLVLPSDHYIDNVTEFHRSIKLAKKYAEQNFLVCFGVTPNKPETGYGYIEFGKQLNKNEDRVCKISKFVEKPNFELAKQYVASGKHYWNSGIFMFRASAYLQELKLCAFDIYKVCEDIVRDVKSFDKIFEIDSKKFEKCRNDSIDYAVMEKTRASVVVPLDVGWSDLGSWQALWEFGRKDQNGNVIIGDVDVKGVNNSYIHTTDRKVVALGIRDCVVIETSSVVLVISKDCCQNVKLVLNSSTKIPRKSAGIHLKSCRYTISKYS